MQGKNLDNWESILGLSEWDHSNHKDPFYKREAARSERERVRVRRKDGRKSENRENIPLLTLKVKEADMLQRE